MRSRILARRLATALPLFSEVSVVAITQFVPMVALNIPDYARYTSIYLIFGVMYGLVLAVICDVWARGKRKPEEAGSFEHTSAAGDPALAIEAENRTYSGALLHAALLAGVINGLLAAVLLAPLSAVLAGVATAVGIARSGNRYFLLANGEPVKAGLSDLVGVCAGVLAWIAMLAIGSSGIDRALSAWFATSLTSVILCSGIRLRRTSGLRKWHRDHRLEIRALLGDALILNLSSVATPYVAALFGGASAMALVRSSSSLLYPVRLVLGVLRPQLVSRGTRNRFKSTLIAAVFGAATGATVGGGLHLVDCYNAFPGSTFSLLASYHLEIGILTMFTAISVYAQFEARGRLAASGLVARRLMHTGVLLAVVVAAVVAGGPSWVPMALGLASALSVPIWIVPGCGRRSPGYFIPA